MRGARQACAQPCRTDRRAGEGALPQADARGLQALDAFGVLQAPPDQRYAGVGRAGTQARQLAVGPGAAHVQLEPVRQRVRHQRTGFRRIRRLQAYREAVAPIVANDMQ
ncbi:hypothetical protein D3C72_1991600 [compost metagenome]